ncbi:GNAT family N-acetyltransferase [Gelidibacter pelagius]|uniref:GNAT family N-acetyltransferase n=1 Tax=Gelidibacter pelagius TaxID=2819985 RepID=A0ABS3SQZ3_9FLAO|nr:GNAT family N-acetyltransferase [Gelidibacter pelagius]MBO3098132.1 GNAT family N-acetyltransferase [Gelidibacter pelagius]
MEGFKFRELKNDPQQFFQILPEDWQDEIVPFWDTYKTDSKIYIIEDDTGIVGGGIVFYKSPPNFEYFETDAKAWFDKGYGYLGFIWISEPYRNKSLGSFWLNQLKSENPQQRYFLLTEEEHLHHFYLKNGFVCSRSLHNEDHLEWLYHT